MNLTNATRTCWPKNLRLHQILFKIILIILADVKGKIFLKKRHDFKIGDNKIPNTITFNI